MSLPFPSPTTPAGSRTEVFLGYLDYFRERLLDKLSGLPAGELNRSRLPSGWTPLQLLRHLTFVERRWLEWGFAGQPVAEPWGDSRHAAGTCRTARVSMNWPRRCASRPRAAGR